MPRRSVPETSGDVILIPKQLRMEWTDAIALDGEVSHTAFRVAAVIGRHFNKHRGDTYLKQETIARIIGVTPRTVWTATMELEAHGYLIIERRELGKRATDGRRACGGRGMANTYRPAFERSQLAATTSGAKLEARCDLIWKQRSQIRARKVATDCDPTLSHHSGDYPAVQILGLAGARLRRRLGEEKFKAWFAGVEQDACEPGRIRLRAPSRMIAGWIRDNFRPDIFACWRAEGFEVADMHCIEIVAAEVAP